MCSIIYLDNAYLGSVGLKVYRYRFLVFTVLISADFFYPRTLISAAGQMDQGQVVFSSLALHSLGKFCLMFFVSAIVGVVFGLASAVVSTIK